MKRVYSLYKKFTDFEIACIAGIVALVADLGWLLHDIVHNGISFWYTTVGMGLIAGILFTGRAWVKYTHMHIRHRHEDHKLRDHQQPHPRTHETLNEWLNR